MVMVVMINRHALTMIMMAFEGPFAVVWFVRNMCVSF